MTKNSTRSVNPQFQEVVLLKILEFGANGKELDYVASLIAFDLVRDNGV
jgi:hypothetical protein